MLPTDGQYRPGAGRCKGLLLLFGPGPFVRVVCMLMCVMCIMWRVVCVVDFVCCVRGTVCVVCVLSALCGLYVVQCGV